MCISGLIEPVDGRKTGDSEENRVKKGKKVDICHVPRGEQCPDLDRRRSGTVFSSSPVPRSRTHSLSLFHVTFGNPYSWYKEITHRIPRHNSCYQPPVGLWPRCASRPSTSSPKYNDGVGPPIYIGCRPCPLKESSKIDSELPVLIETNLSPNFIDK